MIRQVIVDTECADAFSPECEFSSLGVRELAKKLSALGWEDYRIISNSDGTIKDAKLFHKRPMEVRKYPVRVEGVNYIRWEALLKDG